MNTLDDIARSAVAELKVAAAKVARTEEGLEALGQGVPVRRRSMILSFAAATLLLGAGLWLGLHGDDDRTIRPATSSSQVETSVTPTSVTQSTVAAPAVSPTVLRADGVGDARFGMSYDQAIGILRAAFGEPTFDNRGTNPSSIFPAASASTAQAFEITPEGFYRGSLYPAYRRTCWGPSLSTGLCLSFGGERADVVAFVGWDYVDVGPTDSLHLTDDQGLTVGARWSTVQSMLASPTTGCFATALSSTENDIVVNLRFDSTLVSEGGATSSTLPSSANFGDQCSDPGAIAESNLPDMSKVVVAGMRAGRLVGHVPISQSTSPTLHRDGVGDARFGMSYDQAMGILRAVFGEPGVDLPSLTTVTAPQLQNPKTVHTYGEVWEFPAQRITCWTELCVSFGGARADALTMVGWNYSYTNDAKSNAQAVGTPPTFRATDDFGLTLGTKWAQAQPYLGAPQLGCQTVAQALTVSGVRVFLLADTGGGSFGDCVTTSGADLPSPDSVSIRGMSVGQVVAPT